MLELSHFNAIRLSNYCFNVTVPYKFLAIDESSLGISKCQIPYIWLKVLGRLIFSMYIKCI